MRITINKILGFLFVLFGIYIVYFFSNMILHMDSPFWKSLPFSLIAFIPLISGFTLIISGYIIFNKRTVNRNFAFLFWIFSIPLFLYQFLIWKMTIDFIPGNYEKIIENSIYSISLLSFFFISGIFLLYVGFFIFKQK